MARISRYTQLQPRKEKWNAGLYIRLSREDGDKAESESISSQKAIIEHFLSSHSELDVFDYYIDDGWSGTDFERPAFRQMLEDITSGRVNCVIVKDLSRFGRNYIESGKYLETVFPLLKVRFIAINDSVDNIENPASVNSIMLPFKNIINDEYCRDISTKVRSALTAKRFQGKFIGAFASYGYKKDPQDRNKLIIDEEAAQVVRRIFDDFLAGTSIIGITRKLNAAGIENPSAYKLSRGLNCRNASPLWSDRTVRRILSNAIYAGDMVQKKYEIVSYKIHIGRKTREDEWIVVRDTHDAIIPRERFENVQALLKRDTRMSPRDGKLSLFAGFVKCADCGRAMNKKSVTQKKRYDYYVCSTYRRSSHTGCTKHTVRADALEAAVKNSLNEYIRIAVDYEKLSKLINESGEKENRESAIKSLIDAKNGEIAQLSKRLLDLYPDFKDGLLSRDSYFSLKEKYENKIENCRAAIRDLNAQLEKTAARETIADDFVNSLKKYGGFKKLTRDIMTELVDNVFVREGGEIEVQLKCKDALDGYAELARETESKQII